MTACPSARSHAAGDASPNGCWPSSYVEISAIFIVLFILSDAPETANRGATAWSIARATPRICDSEEPACRAGGLLDDAETTLRLYA